VQPMTQETFLTTSARFQMLQGLARRAQKLERCELCSLALRSDHAHLVELAKRKLICTCDACAILFTSGQGGKFKRVPRRVLSLPQFEMSEAAWSSLMVPINMVFFYRSSLENRVIALYPSPAGAMESLLSLESWNEIVETNPVLNDLESDVEGLLVNRLEHSRPDASPRYYLLPIDECFKLVGLIRTHWKGLSGGTEVWEKLSEFFISLKERSIEKATIQPGSLREKEARA
jgi:hypothetical protein